jgi:hypothetical protein
MVQSIKPLVFPAVFWAIVILFAVQGAAAEKQDQELWEVHPNFEKYAPSIIAVLPMDNFSLEPGLEDVLYQNVYDRLHAKGYRRIAVERVREVMDLLGIQTPGQLQGISLQRLASKLNADAVLIGQVDQSAHISQGAYDAIVVSCSLRLIDCQSGIELWKSEQWRAAHRGFAIDPINFLINSLAHSSASRTDRIAWLVQEMLKTLPDGKIQLELDNFLKKAIKINAETE